MNGALVPGNEEGPVSAALVDTPEPDGREYPLLAGLRRPALGIAGPKPAGQDVVLNVSKVASSSSAGAPGIGQLLPVTAGGFPASDMAVVASLGSHDRDAIREAFATQAHSDLETSKGLGGQRSGANDLLRRWWSTLGYPRCGRRLSLE